MALLKFKRSAVSGKVPALGDLELGELAINTFDGKLYLRKDNGTASIVEVGGAGGGGTVTSVAGTGTVNGITLTGTVTSSGSLTLGGTLSGVSLTTQVSGTLPVANGGTGATSLTSGYLVKGNGTSAASASVVYDNGTNVGIGTSSPSQKLEVAGNIRIASGGDLILSSATGGNDSALYNDAQDLFFSVNGATRAYIKSSGDVGIGTTSPASKLSVSGSFDCSSIGQIGTNVAQAAPSSTDIKSTAHAAISGIGGNALFFGQYGSGNGYAQWIQSSFQNPTTATYNLVLNPLGGNVGIGTSSPSQKLTLQGAQLTIPAAGWSSGQVAYNYLGDTNNGISCTNGGYSTYFNFNGHNWLIQGSEAMRIDGSRNVGIGTSTVNARLNVKGGMTWIQNFNGSASSPTEAIDWPVPALNVTSFGDFTLQTMMAFTLPDDGNYFTGDTVWNIRLEQTASATTSSSSTGFRLMGPGYLAFGSGQQERLRFSSSGGITSSDLADAVGYKGLPQNQRTSAYTLALSDMGKHLYVTAGAFATTIPADATVNFPVGAAITFVCEDAGKTIVPASGVTLVLAGTGAATTGTRTLAIGAVATLIKVQANRWYISGSGVT